MRHNKAQPHVRLGLVSIVHKIREIRLNPKNQ